MLLFVFLFFGHMACRILDPQSGTKPCNGSARPPGKSLNWFLNQLNKCHIYIFYWLSKRSLFWAAGFGGWFIMFLEKAMAPHSSVLAWKIPWMEEPGRLQSMGSQRVRHDWSDLAAAAVVMFHHVTIDNWYRVIITAMSPPVDLLHAGLSTKSFSKHQHFLLTHLGESHPEACQNVPEPQLSPKGPENLHFHHLSLGSYAPWHLGPVSTLNVIFF